MSFALAGLRPGPVYRWRVQRGVAILVVVLVALGLTAAFLQSVIPALVDQFQANTLLARLPGELGGSAVGFTRRTFSTLASAVLVAVLTVYFLADLPRLQRGAVLLFPRAHRDRFVRIVGVMVDNGAVICIAVALFATRLWPTTVLVLVFFVVYQQVENYLIAPRIMRGPVQLSAGAVLLAGLIGAAAMGLIGALMAIPIAAGIKVLLSERLQARDAADAGAAAPGDGDRPDDATPG